MDLSTTLKIKRRRYLINGPDDDSLTNCFISGMNFFENRNLSNTKFRISSFRFNNASIPSFLPKYLQSFPDALYFKDLTPTDTVNFYVPSGSNAGFTPTKLDYFYNLGEF